eukprot:sb/3460800/
MIDLGASDTHYPRMEDAYWGELTPEWVLAGSLEGANETVAGDPHGSLPEVSHAKNWYYFRFFRQVYISDITLDTDIPGHDLSVSIVWFNFTEECTFQNDTDSTFNCNGGIADGVVVWCEDQFIISSEVVITGLETGFGVMGYRFVPVNTTHTLLHMGREVITGSQEPQRNSSHHMFWFIADGTILQYNKGSLVLGYDHWNKVEAPGDYYLDIEHCNRIQIDPELIEGDDIQQLPYSIYLHDRYIMVYVNGVLVGQGWLSEDEGHYCSQMLRRTMWFSIFPSFQSYYYTRNVDLGKLVHVIRRHTKAERHQVCFEAEKRLTDSCMEFMTGACLMNATSREYVKNEDKLPTLSEKIHQEFKTDDTTLWEIGKALAKEIEPTFREHYMKSPEFKSMAETELGWWYATTDPKKVEEDIEKTRKLLRDLSRKRMARQAKDSMNRFSQWSQKLKETFSNLRAMNEVGVNGWLDEETPPPRPTLKANTRPTLKPNTRPTLKPNTRPTLKPNTRPITPDNDKDESGYDFIPVDPMDPGVPVIMGLPSVTKPLPEIHINVEPTPPERNPEVPDLSDPNLEVPEVSVVNPEVLPFPIVLGDEDLVFRVPFDDIMEIVSKWIGHNSESVDPDPSEFVLGDMINRNIDPMQAPMEDSMKRYLQGPMQNPMQGPMQNPMQNPMQVPPVPGDLSDYRLDVIEVGGVIEETPEKQQDNNVIQRRGDPRNIDQPSGGNIDQSQNRFFGGFGVQDGTYTSPRIFGQFTSPPTSVSTEFLTYDNFNYRYHDANIGQLMFDLGASDTHYPRMEDAYWGELTPEWVLAGTLEGANETVAGDPHGSLPEVSHAKNWYYFRFFRQVYISDITLDTDIPGHDLSVSIVWFNFTEECTFQNDTDSTFNCNGGIADGVVVWCEDQFIISGEVVITGLETGFGVMGYRFVPVNTTHTLLHMGREVIPEPYEQQHNSSHHMFWFIADGTILQYNKGSLVLGYDHWKKAEAPGDYYLDIEYCNRIQIDPDLIEGDDIQQLPYSIYLHDRYIMVYVNGVLVGQGWLSEDEGHYCSQMLRRTIWFSIFPSFQSYYYTRNTDLGKLVHVIKRHTKAERHQVCFKAEKRLTDSCMEFMTGACLMNVTSRQYVKNEDKLPTLSEKIHQEFKTDDTTLWEIGKALAKEIEPTFREHYMKSPEFKSMAETELGWWYATTDPKKVEEDIEKTRKLLRDLSRKRMARQAKDSMNRFSQWSQKLKETFSNLRAINEVGVNGWLDKETAPPRPTLKANTRPTLKPNTRPTFKPNTRPINTNKDEDESGYDFIVDPMDPGVPVIMGLPAVTEPLPEIHINVEPNPPERNPEVPDLSDPNLEVPQLSVANPEVLPFPIVLGDDDLVFRVPFDDIMEIVSKWIGHNSESVDPDPSEFVLGDMINRNIDPMQAPMEDSMKRYLQNPMQNPMQGPMQNPMQGPMQSQNRGSTQMPMGGYMQNPMQGPMQNPMQGSMQGPMGGYMQNPMQGPMQNPMQNPIQGPMQGSTQSPMQNENLRQVPIQNENLRLAPIQNENLRLAPIQNENLRQVPIQSENLLQVPMEDPPKQRGILSPEILPVEESEPGEPDTDRSLWLRMG